MNDKFMNNNSHDEENIARKLSQVAEKTNVNAQFAAELEEKLRDTHRSKTGASRLLFRISPTLRWVALMILLALALSWSIRSLIPASQPAIQNTPIPSIEKTPTAAPDVLPNVSATPELEQSGYDFRGAKLYLEGPLPTSPDRAHIYLLKKDEPTTQEQARALAEQFGIQGEMYSVPDYVFNTTDFMISDGKQMLQVYSKRYFSYTSDMSKTSRGSVGHPNDNAEAIIHEFFQARGMDFPFSLSTVDAYGGYGIQPHAPDSIPMQYESFTAPVMRVALDENGEVLSVDATLMDYNQVPVGEYGIISAQEALQKLLDDSTSLGKMEFFDSPDHMPQEWFRNYPDNQPLTIYGNLSSKPPIDPGKSPLVLLNGVPLTGNISGLESLDDFSFVKATGQYFVENGIRKFNVEAWDRKVNETTLSGTLSRQGDQIVFTSDDGSGTQYSLIDPPADVPLDTKTPDSQLSISGVITSGKMDWTYIQYFANNIGGGGGGGNGLGFYKLNLNGTPVPFPSPVAQSESNSGSLIIPRSQQATNNANPPVGIYTIKEGDTLSMIAQNFGTTVEELRRLNNLMDTDVIIVGQTLNVPLANVPDRAIENVRGFLAISIHQKADGTETREYSLEVTNPDHSSNFYPLAGPKLDELDPYNGLPIIVSGVINGKTGLLSVNNYAIPYPDLKFQIAKGTQRSEPLGGQMALVFTTEDGKSYMEVIASTNQPATTFTGYQGDMIQQEILIVPDETFSGMPVAHVYQSSIVQENGPEMEIRGNKIQVINEGRDPRSSSGYTLPNLTINRVELVYYVSNPYYQVNDPNYSQRSPYIQPAWHFHGRYEDGTEFDVLVQALKQEFLLPEPAPGISPG